MSYRAHRQHTRWWLPSEAGERLSSTNGQKWRTGSGDWIASSAWNGQFACSVTDSSESFLEVAICTFLGDLPKHAR